MAKPTLDSARRACARALETFGYQRGRKAAVRDLGGGLTSRVTLTGQSNGWVRTIVVSVSLWREGDRVEAHRLAGLTPGGPGDEDTFQPFALSSSFGRLMSHPHDHAWVLEDADDLTRLEEQLRLLWDDTVTPHLQRWVGLLQVAKTSTFLPGGSQEMGMLLDPGLMRLSAQYVMRYFPGAAPELVRPVKRRWLEMSQRCPWGPCGESGRGVSAGGTWPDELVAR